MKDNPARTAAEALSDLNTFAIVVSILEGGHVHAPSYIAAGRIIKIAMAEQQKCLSRYDENMEKVVTGGNGNGE